MEMSASVGFRVSVDSKRRPTLPAGLLREAQLEGIRELVARADGPGRIVLEDPDVVLAAFQDAVEAGRQAVGFTGALDGDLLADRAADTSLA